MKTNNSSMRYQISKKIGVDKTTREIVFRALAPSEMPEDVKSKGLYCRDMNADIPMQKHITGERNSCWISVSGSIISTFSWAMKTGSAIAVIDWDKASSGREIVDARQSLPKLGSTYGNFAKSSMEFGVKYQIPAEAIISVLTFDQVVELCTTDVHSASYYREERRYSLERLKASFSADFSCVEGLANELSTWTDERAFARFDICTKLLWTKNRYTDNKLGVTF